MKSARDRRSLLVFGLACMAFVSVASVTFGFLAREEAKALRVEVEELSIRAEKEAETARQTLEFVADLFVAESPPVGSVTVREILESQGGRLDGQLEGQLSQQLREAAEQARETLEEQD